MSKDLFSPTMREAIDYALEQSGGVRDKCVLVRYPGGFWSREGWEQHKHPWWGTTTIEAIVKRGAAEYVEWQPRKDGSQFPIKVQITL